MRTKAHSQALWAELVLGALREAGIRDVVLSPGSRSTPFVMAAIAHPGLVVHDVVDERAAGFVALGIGRATGKPALLLCTSGTAPAHYYPAVIEASAAFVPLVVLSADRPVDLHGCGANQAVDQTRLFGVHARFFADLGGATDEARGLRAARRVAAQAVAASLGPLPGAVQLNARAEKPLEPPRTLGDAERAADAALRAEVGPATAIHAADRQPSGAALDALEAVVRSGRGVLLAGPAGLDDEAAREAVARLARAASAPIYAEAGSQLRFGLPAGSPVVGAVDALLRSAAASRALAPDYVLQLGAAPVTRGGLALLERHRGALAVIAPYGHPDPESRAAHVVAAPIGATVAALAARLEARPAPPRSEWVASHLRADALAWEVAGARLDAAGDALSEGAVARDVVDALPSGARLALGNSLPIRQVEAWAPPRPAVAHVLVQRGASGIDGLVSAAAGAVLATSSPLVLLLGDLSFLHDAGGLAVASRVRAPLTVVVVNNGGGRIFEQLPVGAFPDDVLGHFVTPTDAGLEDLCRAYRVGYRRATTRTELRAALTEAAERGGPTVVEAVVPPRGAAPMSRELFAAIDARVADELGR